MEESSRYLRNVTWSRTHKWRRQEKILRAKCNHSKKKEEKLVSIRFQVSCLKRASETAESGQPRCSQTQWGDEPLTTDFHLKFISLLKPVSRSWVRHEHKHLQLLSSISLYKSYALGFFFSVKFFLFFTTKTFYCDKSQRSQANLIISISSRGLWVVYCLALRHWGKLLYYTKQ